MTAVGFEPTPLRTGAWSQRLRPLGQTVAVVFWAPNAASIAQLAEHALRKRTVVGSIPTGGFDGLQLASLA